MDLDNFDFTTLQNLDPEEFLEFIINMDATYEEWTKLVKVAGELDLISDTNDWLELGEMLKFKT